MAAREQSGTTIDPGVVQQIAQGKPGLMDRIGQAVRWVVQGVGPENFFGPGQPLQPAAQDRAEGRAWDFPTAINVRIRPRDTENVSFEQLRGLADGYDLMRLAIETRKDQIEAYEWEIVPKDEKANADSMRSRIVAATELMERPNREHDWPQWLRQITEELLVIDTVCVYPRQNRGGGLWGFELVDGATIRRVLDVTGRTPMPPSPAYQQVIKGIPAANYTTESLVYMMRNPRVSRIYGHSPVEQVITTVNIALRRQMSQLEFYTAGNIPDAFTQVPEGWTMKQIAEFQTWWDSLMEGNTAQRRKMRFIPGVKGIDYPKKDALKDEYDEWLARIICFAFSISPSALIKQVNRASGEQMADTAKEEGLIPLLRFLSGFISGLLARAGYGDLRFQFKIVNKVAPEKQAQIHAAYIGAKVITPDEVREEIGMDAMTPEQREAAFPAPPPMPGFGDEEGDGEHTAKPKGPGPKPAPDAAEETPAEKMLADALRMLDPERLAKVIADASRAAAPNVVELRPEVTVGDVNVHVPVERRAA